MLYICVHWRVFISGGGGGGRLDPLNFVKKVEKGEKYFQNQDHPPCELIPEFASVCVQIDYLSSSAIHRYHI